jgi:hypothetical protein
VERNWDEVARESIVGLVESFRSQLELCLACNGASISQLLSSQRMGPRPQDIAEVDDLPAFAAEVEAAIREWVMPATAPVRPPCSRIMPFAWTRPERPLADQNAPNVLRAGSVTARRSERQPVQVHAGASPNPPSQSVNRPARAVRYRARIRPCCSCWLSLDS